MKTKIISILFLTILSGCTKNSCEVKSHTGYFQAGDCFDTPNTTYKIVEVGQFSYKTFPKYNYWRNNEPVIFTFKEAERYEKVDCFDLNFGGK